MKIVYGVFALIAASVLLVSHRSDVALSDNGRAGSTGSPGTTTCASCHGGAGAGSATLTSDIPAGGFVPGGTYNVSVTVNETGSSLFGLGVEALTTSNTNAGTLGISDAASTQLKARAVGGVSRQNIVHQLNGGVSPNSKTFSFRWTAPTVAAGNVTFYYAGMSANGNGSEDAGDKTYAGSVVFSPQTMAACPTLNTAPANVNVSNSSCGSGCLTISGSITAPAAACPTGSRIQYSVNGGAWTTTLPTYTPLPQTIQTRCSCESDPTQNSPTSTPVITSPATCEIPTAPTVNIVNNVLPSTVGTITATGCGTGTVVEYATSPTGQFSTTAPAYTLSPITVYARCRNTASGCVSDLASGTTAPNPPSVVTLNCPSNITVTAATGATTAMATYTEPVGTSTCATGTATTTRTSGLASGAAFPIGTTQVCYTVTDGCGVTKTCCFNVVVNAAATPVITLNCPPTVTVTAATAATTATATYIEPTGTSTCPTGTVTTSRTSGLASGGAFPIGTTQVCYTATDGCGGTKSCCFNVVVNAAATPVITLNCPPTVTVTAAMGATTAIATYIEPIGTSTCPTGTVTTTRTSGLASGASFPIGTTQVCYTTIDGCGGSKMCCFNVVVNTGSTSPICSGLKIKGDDDKIKIENLPRTSATIPTIRVINTATNQVVFQCTACKVKKGKLEIKNIPTGTYRVEVSLYQSSTLICQTTVTVTVSDDDYGYDDDDDDDDFRGFANGSQNGTIASLENTSNSASATEGGIEEDKTVVYLQKTPKSASKSTVVVFPNPANNLLDVDITYLKGQAATIQIFNQLGQLVHSNALPLNAATVQQIHLDKLPEGFYILCVQSAKQRISQRFVVQR
jgi:Secretion system C-terminal sorting domain/HYR domain